MRGRIRLLAALAPSAIALAPTVALAARAAQSHHCGNAFYDHHQGEARTIVTRNVSCTVGRRVAAAWGKRVDRGFNSRCLGTNGGAPGVCIVHQHWRCSNSPAESRGFYPVACVSTGDRRVRFLTAD